EADGGPRPVRRLLDPDRAPAAGIGVPVCGRDRGRGDPAAVHPGGRARHPGGGGAGSGGRLSRQRLQGGAIRRLLSRRGLHRNVVQDGGHPGISERQPQLPASAARADPGARCVDAGRLPGRRDGRSVVAPGPHPWHGARRPPGERQGAGPRGRAGPLRHDVALDHARAWDLPREVPRVPGGPPRRRAEGGGGAEKGARGSEGMRRWLRLWFFFSEPVDRRTYLLNGAGLMLFKYAVDVAVVWTFADRLWTPLTYLNPLWVLREQTLRDAPAWLGPALVLWTLPFLWIGVSMTLRRAVDAGRSPWWGLLFFVPVVNYAVMLWLALLPSRADRGAPAVSPVAVDLRVRAGLLGVAAALAITIPTVLLGVYLRRMYSAGLFLGTPFTIGYISAYVFNARGAQSERYTMEVALLAVALAGGAMLMFALEGAVCIALAFPIAALLALPGAIIGRAVALRGAGPPARAGLAALLAPLVVLGNPRQTAPSHEVVTAVDIDAPPAVVWRHVVSFPDLPPPHEWLFRAGVAAPLRARIEGTGVGATRYCDFTTGSFVEPITVWEENH